MQPPQPHVWRMTKPYPTSVTLSRTIFLFSLHLPWADGIRKGHCRVRIGKVSGAMCVAYQPCGEKHGRIADLARIPLPKTITALS